MFLIDDFLLWVVEQVHDAAQEEMAGEAERITEQLRQLYMMLESGQITEAEFNAQERRLLDRLDAIEARDAKADEEDAGDADTDEKEDDEH